MFVELSQFSVLLSVLLEVIVKKKDILSLIEKIFEIDEGLLREESVLKDIDAWDSLGVLNLVALVDEKVGVVLSPNDLEKCQTLADIFALFSSRLEP